MYGRCWRDGSGDQLKVFETGGEWWEQYILSERRKTEGFSYPL
jgi:hypothetical protein